MVDGRRSRSRRVALRRALSLVAAVVAVALLAAGCLNRGTWSAAPAPVAPVQDLDTWMTDVSCVSEDWCLAVGSMGSYPLAQAWDGSAWSVITAPSLDDADNTAMSGIECGSPTSCVAKVSRSYPSADLYDYALGWDGSHWHELAGGSEGPYVDTIPFGCAADGSCLIVDNAWQRTVVWDGDSATTIPYSTTAPPSEINAIECFSADRCVAATSYTTALWDGAVWSELPGGENYETFRNGAESMACSALDNCLAVGMNLAETGPTSATWDGATWTEVPLPAGVTAAGVVECAGPDECLVRVVAGGSGAMLAWMGGAWRSAPAPPPGSAGMSCVPLRCLAVGSSGSPATPTAATYAWTNP